jgi:hypothetical protein
MNLGVNTGSKHFERDALLEPAPQSCIDWLITQRVNKEQTTGLQDFSWDLGFFQHLHSRVGTGTGIRKLKL